MPLYGFFCKKCEENGEDISTFTVLLPSGQSMCDRATPNRRRAYCPTCKELSFSRDYSDTHLNQKPIRDCKSAVELLGQPRYDPDFGAVSVNGGRDDRKVFIRADIQKDDRMTATAEANKEVFLTRVYPCVCEYCNPKPIVKYEPTASDIALADMLSKTGQVADPSKVAYAAKTEKAQTAFQNFLSAGDGIEGEE